MTAILVQGIAESGTSALYAALKTAMPHALTVSDARQPQQFDFVEEQPHLRKLVEVVLPRIDLEKCDLGFFEKKVHVQRDPRDCFVGTVLNGVFLNGANDDRRFVDSLVNALRRKEADPRSVSMRSLVSLYASCGWASKNDEEFAIELRQATEYSRRFPNSAVLRYDDFKAGNLSRLSDYLTIELSTEAAMSGHIRDNECERRTDTWRDWFTPEDVAHYRPIIQPTLDHFRFDLDWSLSEAPSISPATASERVERTVSRLERLPNLLGTLRGRDFYSEEYVAHLRSAIDDGAEGAMIELALANLVGYVPNASRDAYLRWMLAARRRRNPSALIHWGVALERLVATDQSHTASHYFDVAAAMIGNSAAKRRIVHIRDKYTEHGIVRPS